MTPSRSTGIATVISEQVANALLANQGEPAPVPLTVLSDGEWSQLYERRRVLVRAMLSDRLHGSEIDEVVPEAWRRIVRNYPKFRKRDDERAFVSWLRRICRSSAVDYIRRQRRREVPLNDEVRQRMVERLRERARLNQYRRSVLEGAIELTLDDREAQIIRSHYWEKRSQRAIAEDLGISQPRVAKIIKRAARKLRAVLEDQADALLTDHTYRTEPRSALKPTADGQADLDATGARARNRGTLLGLLKHERAKGR